MKVKYFIIIIPFLMLLASCGSGGSCKVTIEAGDSVITKNSYSLLEFIDKTGNIVEKNEFPYLVKAYDLYIRLKEYLVIDIRTPEEYAKGHIEGAYNVQRDSLLYFFEHEVSPSGYSKIAVVDDNGPVSLYVSTLLRFAGYNAYALKYGMGAWNNKFVGNISSYISNKYASIVETQNTVKPHLNDIPEFNSDNILQFIDDRVFNLIAEDMSNIIISPDVVVANPDDYFVLAYWPEETYDAGHFPGSVRYTPRFDLLPNSFLGTLPTDKRIVVYCYTGHHAASVVAYLRLVGYDAVSFMYGANSFMSVKLTNASPGTAVLDVNTLTNVYPIIEGQYRTSSGPGSVSDNSTDAPPAAVIPVQQNNNQQNGGGGGCG
ncbi:MAG: rhodanese-like domain-containing protein [Bacteroidales bacterium]|nr:rhodanese-like domain-containing protein [Bacteroidales bacterium]